MLIYGINPVLEALRAGRVASLRVSARGGDRVAALAAEAQREGVDVRRVAPAEIDRAAKGGVHQGVVADVRDQASYSIQELVAGSAGAPLLVVLDGIEDP